MKKDEQIIEKKNKKWYRRLIAFGILAILLWIAGLFIVYQLNLRFTFETRINGVDCSFLTVSEAQEKLNTEISNQLISFTVLTRNDNSEYTKKKYMTTCKSIGIYLNADLQNILDEQKESHEKIYTLPCVLNQEALSNFLLTINELLEENQIEPANAYLQINEGYVEIVDEVYGLKIDFEEAYNIAVDQITLGNFEIDFSNIFETEPEILSTDEALVENQAEINQILDSVITFTFTDGTEQVLDRNTIVDWIIQDSDGFFSLDETNITAYAESLSEIVSEKNSFIQFNATGIDPVTFSVKQSMQPQLDIEAEILLITEAIYSGKTQTLQLIYDQSLVTDSNTYVELDITRQKVWLYVDGSCIMETDVVTGSVASGYSTPTGIYNLTYKTRGATLRGYNSNGSLAYASYVEYWMPFNGGIGFHDASWRSEFGGSIYLTNGSHGCVNMPFDAAQTLYQYINTEMSIFVYAS